VKSFLAGIFAVGMIFGSVVERGIPALAEEPAPSRVEAGHAAVAPKKPVPDFVPIVVDRAQYEAVMGHLNGMVFKDALPLVKWLSELEDRAKRQWEADNAPKPETPKP
jgi:hypothetical protein